MPLNNETLARFAAIDRARAKTARADAAKASWDKVLARVNGKPRASAAETKADPKAASAWAGAVAKKNDELSGTSGARASGWSKAIDKVNSRLGS